MGKKRKKYSPEFKVKVLLAPIKNDETISELTDIADIRKQGEKKLVSKAQSK